MKNFATARNFEIHKSEVLQRKTFIVVANENFCMYDIFQMLKLLKGNHPKSKIKFVNINPEQNAKTKNVKLPRKAGSQGLLFE
jgi:hypothetical protein